MAGENWERLGDYVVARRTALGMRDRRALAAATGVTDRTLGKIENGKRVSASTLGAVENHLGWAPGPCRRLLAARAPSIRPPAGPPHHDDPAPRARAGAPGRPPDA